MTPNSLSPASVKIDYHSVFGAHAMTIPTKEWLPTPLSGGLGSYVNWDGTPVDGQTMVTQLVNVLRVFMPSDAAFDQATAYTQATPTSDNIPRASVSLAIAGTSISATNSQAVSLTFNFKTVANGDSRLVLLDSPIGGLWFAPVYPSAFNAETLAVEGMFCSTSWAWAGRDDSRPAVLRKLTKDLNDKLQKQYWH